MDIASSLAVATVVKKSSDCDASQREQDVPSDRPNQPGSCYKIDGLSNLFE